MFLLQRGDIVGSIISYSQVSRYWRNLPELRKSALKLWVGKQANLFLSVLILPRNKLSRKAKLRGLTSSPWLWLCSGRWWLLGKLWPLLFLPKHLRRELPPFSIDVTTWSQCDRLFNISLDVFLSHSLRLEYSCYFDFCVGLFPEVCFYCIWIPSCCFVSFSAGNNYFQITGSTRGLAMYSYKFFHPLECTFPWRKNINLFKVVLA